MTSDEIRSRLTDTVMWRAIESCVFPLGSPADHQLDAMRDTLVAALTPDEMPPNKHTLTLKFGRFLTQDEWRVVVDAARQVPHVKALVAHAVTELLTGALDG